MLSVSTRVLFVLDSKKTQVENEFPLKSVYFLQQQLSDTGRPTRQIVGYAKWLCAQQRLRWAWASALSNLRTQAFFMRTAKTLIRLDASFLHADGEDSDQSGRMPRMIWLFAGHTVILLVLSCCGSFLLLLPFKYYYLMKLGRNLWNTLSRIHQT